MTKRTNPYERLRSLARDYLFSLKYPEKKMLWYYAKKDFESGHTMRGLAERVAAADLLGYDTKLANTDRGLEVWFVKRPKNPPCEIAPD